MGMAPDFGTKVDSGEDGGGVDPNVVENVGTEWSDKEERMGVEVWNTGDVAKEVPFNELFLGYPEFLTLVIDNSVLVGMSVDDEGAGGSGKKVGEEFI